MSSAPDFFTVVHSQRACRVFSDRPVDDDDVARVLDAAVHAPSAENKQPWEFVVVRDVGTRNAIGALMTRAWEARGRAFSRDRLSPALLASVERGATGGVAAAPVHVVVAADTERGLAAAAAESIYPAVQNLLLAATAVGLGSALTTIALGYGDELRDLVGLPESVRPMAVVPLGHPERPLAPPVRAPFTTRTHRERYGTAWDQGTVGSA
ncbi:MAG: nitroreductase family protein [Acidimicrobiia bacterium]